MAKFTVEFEQTWFSTIEVEADNENEAWALSDKIAIGEDDVDRGMDWDPSGFIDVIDVFEGSV